MSEKPNPKSRGLGRGLNALFEDSEDDFIQAGVTKAPVSAGEGKGADDTVSAPAGGKSQQMMPIEQIQPCTAQPRQKFNQETLEELAISIREHGVIQPLIVRPAPDADGQYEIIAGERRWRASQLAQLHEIPVIIKDINDDEAFQIALIENLQREDLDPVDEATSYKHLMDEFGYTQDQLAKSLGKSRSHIANTARLLNLPTEVLYLLTKGELSPGHARALIAAEYPIPLAEEILKKKLNVRQTEALIADAAGRKKPKSAQSASGQGKSGGHSSKDVNVIALEDELSNLLGMRVEIATKSGKSGLVSVEFKSLDQLDSVIARLRGLDAKSPGGRFNN